MQIGIVGLPNVGKSTLFQAITKKRVAAENYPFCTIEPNVGTVAVPDERLAPLSDMSKSEKTIPTTIEFVDIAGLVEGASTGEGLGNQFLSHIRECDAIAHVVRTFKDGSVHHVSGTIDPKRDTETINTELILADMTVLEKHISNIELVLKKKKNEADEEKLELLKKMQKALDDGLFASTVDIPEDLKTWRKQLNLITAKPFMYVRNVHEDEVTEGTPLDDTGIPTVTVSAKIESELAQLPESDAKEMLESLGWNTSGLDRVISTAYTLLHLITFLTTGEKETRAWTVPNGTTAPHASGVIHTDFIDGFIRAEVVSYDKLIEAGSWSNARDNGTLRTEGKEYVIQDGDVVHFLVNT